MVFPLQLSFVPLLQCSGSSTLRRGAEPTESVLFFCPGPLPRSPCWALCEGALFLLDPAFVRLHSRSSCTTRAPLKCEREQCHTLFNGFENDEAAVGEGLTSAQPEETTFSPPAASPMCRCAGSLDPGCSAISVHGSRGHGTGDTSAKYAYFSSHQAAANHSLISKHSKNIVFHLHLRIELSCPCNS